MKILIKHLLILFTIVGYSQIYSQNNKNILTNSNSGKEIDSSIIGFATMPLFFKLPESFLGNFVADAVKYEAELATRKRVDVVYISKSAIRGQINKGDVTIGSVRNILPFDDSISFIQLPGNILQTFLDRIAIKGGGAMSGLQMKIKNMRADSIVIGEDPISEKKIYTIAVIEKNAAGEEGFSFLTVFPHQNLPNTLTSLLIKYIKKITTDGRPISAYFDHRIRYD